MKTAWIACLALAALCTLLPGCDHGSKQEFSNQIRLAGHFGKK